MPAFTLPARCNISSDTSGSAKELLALVKLTLETKTGIKDYGQKLEQLRVNHVAIPRDLYHQVMQETDSVKILGTVLGGYEAKKIKKNRFTYIRSMWIYGKNKNFSTVESILNDMRTKSFPIDTVVYNMLIKVHSDASQFDRVEFYYKEMLHQHIRPDVVTYNTMMKTF